MIFIKKVSLPLLIFFFSLLVCFFYWINFTPQELTFSDGAHYAIVARQLVTTAKWQDLYSFWDGSLYQLQQIGHFKPTVLPLTSLSIAVSFLIFKISNLSAIIPGIVFTSLSATLLFLFSRKYLPVIFAFLSSMVFITFQPVLDYATSAASEPLFTFLVLLSIYLIDNRKTIFGILILILSLAVRQHGIFYIFGLILALIFNLPDSKRNKALIYFFISIPVSILIIFFLSGSKIPFISYLPFREFQALIAHSSVSPDNTLLRSDQEALSFPILITKFFHPIFTKIIYNLYNLLKLLPQIFPPYLIPFAFIALFGSQRLKFIKHFFISSFLINLLVIAASVPSFRYFHPFLPFVIFFATYQIIKIKSRFNLILLYLLIFLVLPISSLVLDQRFYKNTHNFGKPSAVKLLSSSLKTQTPGDAVILTNLDAWGSWFGKRTTILFPLSPANLEEQVRLLKGNNVNFIYITSYKANDANHFVSPGWQSLLKTPPQLNNDFLSKYYQIINASTYPPQSNFDNLKLSAILLKKI